MLGEETTKIFLNYLRDLCNCEIISPFEIVTIGKFVDDEINGVLIAKYLCQMSQNVALIKPEIIKKLLNQIENSASPSSIPPKKFKIRMGKSISTRLQSKLQINLGPSAKVITERGEKLLLNLADYLYDNNMTLYKLVNHKIFSKTIDGKEYQLIRQEDLYECLQ